MLKKEFSFELITQNGYARLGRIHTPKGEIDAYFLLNQELLRSL